MSIDALQAVADQQLLEAHPTLSAVADLHVPFGDLTGDPVEDDLMEGVKAQARVGLTGSIGGGKTSVIQYVLAQHATLAPISVNVAVEEPDVVKDPRQFFGVITRELLRNATKAKEISARQAAELQADAGPSTALPETSHGASGNIGVSWIVEANLGGDIETTLAPPEQYNDLQGIAAATHAALDVIEHAKLVPVLVADDADRLLRLPDQEKGKALYEGFFGETLRAVADHLPIAVLIAIQDGYLERDDFAELHEGRIEPIVEVPVLDSAEQFRAILDKRLDRAEPDSLSAADICEDGTLARLAELHVQADGDRTADMRLTFNRLNAALTTAVDEDAPLIAVRHLEAAAAG